MSAMDCTTTPTIYLTCASRPKLEKAREVAPSVEHGIGALPSRLSHASDAPWFLDNGAYTDNFDAEAFRRALDRAIEYDRLPAFVVVPDVLGDATATTTRAAGWVEEIADRGLVPYGAIQPGRLADQFAALPECVGGVLVGGVEPDARRDWRRAPTGISRSRILFICELAAERDLAVHIGRPGVNLAWWVHETPIDSLDTASIGRNDCWDRLRRVEAASDPNQQRLGDHDHDAAGADAAAGGARR